MHTFGHTGDRLHEWMFATGESLNRLPSAAVGPGHRESRTRAEAVSPLTVA
jgi:hypothetical protein